MHKMQKAVFPYRYKYYSSEIEQTNYGPCSMNFVCVEYAKTNTLNELIPAFCREGRYRNPNTCEYDNTASLSMIHRGYTGHVQRNTVFESEAHQKQIVEQIPMKIGKMLSEFDLIHMNGRMYDFVLGRMLSPDNYVQDPQNPQNYNRFGIL
ncbi:MAG: hypothetical protein ACQES1_03910 [Bacteroidota bacterium]